MAVRDRLEMRERGRELAGEGGGEMQAGTCLFLACLAPCFVCCLHG